MNTSQIYGVEMGRKVKFQVHPLKGTKWKGNWEGKGTMVAKGTLYTNLSKGKSTIY